MKIPPSNRKLRIQLIMALKQKNHKKNNSKI